PAELQAVEAGHPDMGHHHRRAIVIDQRPGRIAASGAKNLVPIELECRLDHLPGGCMLVYDQNWSGVVRRAGRLLVRRPTCRRPQRASCPARSVARRLEPRRPPSLADAALTRTAPLFSNRPS